MARRQKRLFDQPPERVQVTSISHEGRGIASIEGKTTFIRSALPGEDIDFQRTYRSGKYDEGRLVKVHTASPHRQAAKCEFFGTCGGCSHQHMTSDYQLELKQNTLLEQLKHFGNATPARILPPLSTDEYGYRRKARLGVRYVEKKERVLIGFREVGGRYIADISHCEVLHPHLGKKLTELGNLIQNLSCFDQIAQVEFSMGDTQAALLFRHLKPLTESDKQALIAFGQTHSFHIYGQPNKPETLYKLWPQDGDERLHYRIDCEDITMAFHPTEFTQVNFSMNNQMIPLALELLDLQATDNALDLFCGVGNFSLAMAKHAKHVTGVEAAISAIARAKENSKLNQLSNTRFEVANLFENVDHMSWAKKTYDKILLDPPRSGAQEIIAKMSLWQPKRLVYISCNPATLARDAGILVNEQGYRLEACGVMNMFPQTAHVESIALFLKE